MSITEWGWNSYFETFWQRGNRKSTVPARVVRQQREFWRVAGDFRECWASASGKLRLAADDGADWPAIGDWVAAEVHGKDTTAVIQEVLARRSKFVRKSPGKKVEEQVIAANVDTALLLSALDGDFNPRRVERYLAQCWESGARPVIVLNKADACPQARGKAAEMQRVAAGKLNKIIADELNVSIRTVEVHRARVFSKLGVRSAAEVATLLAELGA